MKDEIKQLLDELKDKNCYINDETMLSFEDGQILLDYITNLQEEMEKLRSDYIGKKLKIDRAKQYIENHRIREKSIVDVDVLEGILNE